MIYGQVQWFGIEKLMDEELLNKDLMDEELMNEELVEEEIMDEELTFVQWSGSWICPWSSSFARFKRLSCWSVLSSAANQELQRCLFGNVSMSREIAFEGGMSPYIAAAAA